VSTQLHDALIAWRTLLGDEAVEQAPEHLKSAQTATFESQNEVLAILTPRLTAHIPPCLRIAQQHRVPLYPISQGKNWGLGSRVPTSKQAVILDLSHLNQIIEWDETLATITVEPGVTFQQVHDFLKKHQSRHFLAVIGGSPDASLIGNALERGDAIGPYGERQEVSSIREIVLANGEVIHPGFGHFGDNDIDGLYRWGLGPSCEGLFSQSNFGVVTKMTFWLMPKPRFLQLFFCELADLDQLEQTLARAQTLLLEEIIPRNCINFWNIYKLLARKQQLPLELLDTGQVLRWEDLPGQAPWYASGALYCHHAAHAKLMRELVEDALAPTTQSLFFFDQDSHPQLLENNPFLGIPSDENVRSTYWRKRSAPPEEMDPDGDMCGALWLCPMLPFRQEIIRDFVESCQELIFAHGFEPNIGFGCPSGRVVRVFIAINYDREVDGEDQRAMECHDALFAELRKRGHMPYRLGLQSMQDMPARHDGSKRLLRRIKEEVDPHGILAPGRYDSECIKSE